MDFFNPLYKSDSIQPNTYILDFKQGDVNGDNIIETVYLVGHKNSPNENYADNLAIILKKRNNNFVRIPLNNAGGYDAKLFLGTFTSNQKLDILVSIDSGGSGGYIFAFLYTLQNNQPIELINAESFNENSQYNAVFKDDFNVEVSSISGGIKFIIDLSSKRDFYINAGIYNRTGTLVTATTGGVLGLGALFPLVNNYNGLYQLLAYQRIIGINNADNLGAVQIYLEWNGKEIAVSRVAVSIMPS